MDFEWDSEKSERCLRERGFDFAFVSLVFEGRVIEQLDVRRDYGEARVKAVGTIDGSIYAVIYTDRDDVRRIVSARPANRKERDQWLSSG